MARQKADQHGVIAGLLESMFEEVAPQEGASVDGSEPLRLRELSRVLAQEGRTEESEAALRDAIREARERGSLGLLPT